uniref:Uncharacterized protein n=1 Tax=Timema bartmani TaxID=61472 RepID=A0A7R9F396_9NEOP|nr:unnamed protein product [Timema bartmani]
MANQAVCLLLTVQRMRYQIRMRTDMRFDWLSRAEHLGEDCEMCRACDTHHSSRWPQCCQHNSMCCSQLAAACQHCDKHDLINFCNKHFKSLARGCVGGGGRGGVGAGGGTGTGVGGVGTCLGVGVLGGLGGAGGADMVGAGGSGGWGDEDDDDDDVVT